MLTLHVTKLQKMLFFFSTQKIIASLQNIWYEVLLVHLLGRKLKGEVSEISLVSTFKKIMLFQLLNSPLQTLITLFILISKSLRRYWVFELKRHLLYGKTGRKKSFKVINMFLFFFLQRYDVQRIKLKKQQQIGRLFKKLPVML